MAERDRIWQRGRPRDAPLIRMERRGPWSGDIVAVFGAELEAGRGAVGKRWRRRDDAENQLNPNYQRFVVKHRLIPGSRLVIETVPAVQTNRRMTQQQKCPR
jgi:hypothetical protein